MTFWARARWLILTGLLALVLAAGGAVVPSSVLAYDAPTVSRADAHRFNGVDAEEAKLSAAGKESAWWSPEPPGTSTTPDRSVVATEAVRADFVVDSRGTTVPTDPARLRAGLEDSGAFQDLSTNPGTTRKFVGVDGGDPIRIRVDKAHFDDPTFTGPPDPLHTIDHLHVERRLSDATGAWTEAWKIPYVWPF